MVKWWMDGPAGGGAASSQGDGSAVGQASGAPSALGLRAGAPLWTVMLLLVTLFWGSSFVAVKHILGFVGPLELVTARFVPTALVFAAILLLVYRRQTWQLIRQETWRLLLLALTGAVVNNIFLGWGMTRVAAGTASLIVALNPTFVFVLSMLVLREPFVWTRALGLAIAFGGLSVIVLWGSGQAVTLDDIGYALLTMLAPFLWASFTVLGKSVVARHPPVVVIGVSMTLAGLISLLFVRPSLVSQVPALPGSFWLAVLFLALPCTVFAFVVWFGALEKMPAARVAAFIYLVPVWAIALSHWLLHETLTGALIVGAAILLAGVWLVNRR